MHAARRTVGWSRTSTLLALAVALASCDPEWHPREDAGAPVEPGDSGSAEDAAPADASVPEPDASTDPEDAAEHADRDVEEDAAPESDSGDASPPDATALDAAPDAASGSDMDASDGQPELDAAAEAAAELDADAASEPLDTGLEPPPDALADADAHSEASTPPRVCGGPDHLGCADDEFCNTGMPIDARDFAGAGGCGAPDAWGTCAHRPSEAECQVPGSWVSVCDCNGITRIGPCLAHAMGISVAYDRHCAAPPQSCGTDEFSPAGTQHCNMPGSVCVPPTCLPGTLVFGTCKLPPASCPEVDDPVCACGATYRNSCLADQAGKPWSPGACVVDTRPRPCHVPFYVGVDLGCLPGQYCNTSTRCWVPGRPRPGEGFCQSVPQSCPPADAPVCGCDGVTYPNECEAFRASASVIAQGPCGS